MPSDEPEANPARLPSVSVSSSGRSTDAIAETSPAVYAVAPLAVSTLPIALSTAVDVVGRGRGVLAGRWKLKASFSRPL